MLGFLFVLFVLFVQLYSGVFMALVRSVTLDTSDMPRRTPPAVILSSTSTRTGSAKGRRKGARGSRILGRRGGFPHPAPSTVPQGSLETKSRKYPNTTFDLLSAGAIHHINVVPQGTGNADRLGYKIRNTAVHLKGQFSCDTGGPRVAVCGYIMVWDKSPNLAFPAISTIFNIDAGAGYDMSNTFPVDNDRFVIIKSKRRTITYNNAASSNQVLVDDFIKLPKWCVTGFVKGNGAGTVANTQTGALFLVPYRAVTVSGTDDKVLLNMTSELFFAEA